MKETIRAIRLVVLGAIMFCVGVQVEAQELDPNVPNCWSVYSDFGTTTTTGGGDGQMVTVSTLADLIKYCGSADPYIILVSGTITATDPVTVKSNKTIIGKNGAELSGLGFSMSGVSNIIIRNMNIHGSADGIAARNTHHLWIDHCQLWDNGDGLLDITLRSSNCTVSWTKFYYVNQVDHRLSSLVGSGGGDHPEDWGYLRVTHHHNWFADKCNERQPRTMYGKVHVFNDYYTATGNDYCIGVGSYGSVLVENNYFKGVKNPVYLMYNIYCWVTSRGNTFDNTTGSKENGKLGERDVSVLGWAFPVSEFKETPYLYTLDKVADVPTLVSNGSAQHADFAQIGLVPSPGQGAVEVFKPTLKWTKGTIGRDATSYKVYLGTSTSPSLVSTVTTQSYTPSALLPNTVYYWRVDMVTPSGTIAGKLWRFRTSSTPLSNSLPMVSFTAPANNASSFTSPANITLSATASDADGTISKVEFYNGAELIASDDASPYSIVWENVAAGAYTLTAKAIDNSGGVSKSQINITVKAPSNKQPWVAISEPLTGATYTAPATITIKASASDPDGGSITKLALYNGSTLLSSTSSTSISYNWSNVAAGTYTLTAKATDNGGMTITSLPVVVIVKSSSNKAPTVSLTAPANNASFTSPNTILLTANAADANGSINRVEFYAGTTLIGTDASSPYSFVWTEVPAGTYSITAKAIDNEGAVTTSSAITIVVDAPGNASPKVSLTAPANNSTYVSPASITFEATASDADGSVSKVEFYSGTTLIGSDASSPYSYTWTGVAAGTYTITAKAIDDKGAETISSAITVVVGAAPATYIYNNATTGDWTTPANWTPQTVPTAIDTAIIRTGEAKIAQDYLGYIKVETNGILRASAFTNLATVEMQGGALKVNTSNQTYGMKANIVVKTASSIISGSNALTLFTLDGTISGSANLSKQDLGILKLKADASAFKGMWIVEQDTLTIASATGLGQGGAVVNAAGVLDIALAAATNALTIDKGGKLNLGANLTVATAVFGGVNIPAGTYTSADYPAVISGSGSLTVQSCPACATAITQTIQLQKGWNLISTNVRPTDSSIVTLFKGLDVQEIKTMDEFWRKGQTEVFNSLKTITSGEGYLVNMNVAGTLTVVGTPISFSNFQINAFSNWTLIGCPYQSATSFSTIFNATNCSVVKNFEGFWIPSGTSNSIQNMETGKGYFIKK